MTVGPVGEIGSELERSLPVNTDLSRQQARSVTSTLPTRRSQVNYHRHESPQGWGERLPSHPVVHDVCAAIRTGNSALRGEPTSPETTMWPKGWEMGEKTAAFRQRRAADTARWRERVAQGRACYTVEVDGRTFDLMERLVGLPTSKLDDRGAVGAAPASCCGSAWRRCCAKPSPGVCDGCIDGPGGAFGMDAGLAARERRGDRPGT